MNQYCSKKKKNESSWVPPGGAAGQMSPPASCTARWVMDERSVTHGRSEDTRVAFASEGAKLCERDDGF